MDLLVPEVISLISKLGAAICSVVARKMRQRMRQKCVCCVAGSAPPS